MTDDFIVDVAEPQRVSAPAAPSGPLGAYRRVTSEGVLAAARLILDAVVVVGAAAFAYVARFGWDWLALQAEQGVQPLTYFVLTAVWVFLVLRAMAARRLYQEDTLFPGGAVSRRVWRSVLEAVGVLSIALFLAKRSDISRGWFVIVAASSAAALMVERLVVRELLDRAQRRGILRRPAVLVAGRDGDEAQGETLSLQEFDVLARFRPSDFLAWLRSGADRFDGSPGRVPAVFVEAEGLERDETWRVLLEAGQARMPAFLKSHIRGVALDRLTVREVGDHTVVKVLPPRLKGMRAFEKRVFDMLVTLLLAPLLVLLCATIGLVVLITSGPPILFRQPRVGLGGRIFRMSKFRTMRDACEPTEHGWTVSGDPRRTSVGRLLRRLGLDELPQFWNVLRGEMSIVGPRPEQRPFVDRFSTGIQWYGYRHRIRPGITGLAQAKGLRGDTPLESRVELDNWYIEHASIWLDLRILALTAVEVVRGRNAY